MKFSNILMRFRFKIVTFAMSYNDMLGDKRYL